MALPSDAELLRLIAHELRLDGGCSELSSLPTANPRIRKLLGDRKLWAFAHEHPQHFLPLQETAEAADDSGTNTKLWLRLLVPPPVEAQSAAAKEPPGGWEHRCSGCDAGFNSRNAMFKHLRKPGACPAMAGDPASGTGPMLTRSLDPLDGLSAAGKTLVLAVRGALRDHAGGDVAAVPLPWVVSPAKSTSALRRFARESGALAAAEADAACSSEDGSSLRVFSPRWWLVAMRAMHALLCGLPALFELSIKAGAARAGSPLSSDELRRCTIMETSQRDSASDAAADVLADVESGVAISRRVVQLLEWQAVMSGRAAPVTLSVLARDRGLQKHLGSRALLPLLQAHRGEAAFELVSLEARGWCAVLPEAHVISRAVASSGGRVDASSRDAPPGTQLPSLDDLDAICHRVEVLAVVNGAVVLNKPCGVSTEMVIDWLQRVPPSEVLEEINRHKQLDGVPEEEYALESVSRLDKPTSGVLVVPLSRAAAAFLTEQFRSRTVGKTYICLCSGVVPLTGRFDSKLRTLSRGKGSKTAPHPEGKEALTEFRKVCGYRGCGEYADVQLSLCEVFPRTGRTHQIRAHFAHGGHPLAGDVKYGGAAVGERLFLHSRQLRFVDVGGVRHDVAADLPPELVDVLQGLVKQEGE